MAGGSRRLSPLPPAPYKVQFKQQFAVSSHVTFLIRAGGNPSFQPESDDSASQRRRFYDAGSTVNFTASDGPGFQFAHWYGDLTGSDAQKSIVVNDQVDVTGEFLSPGFVSQQYCE